MPTNHELEMRWVNAWNDLYQVVGETPEMLWNAKRLLPDGTVVGVEECQGWLQSSACKGWLLRVEPGCVLGRRGAITSRWRDDE